MRGRAGPRRSDPAQAAADLMRAAREEAELVMFTSIKQALDGAGLTPRQVRSACSRPLQGRLWQGSACWVGGLHYQPACAVSACTHSEWPVCADGVSSGRTCMRAGSTCASASRSRRLRSA